MVFKSTKDTPKIDTPVDTSQDIELGATLQGSPTSFDEAVGARLMEQGLAARVDEGWVRGFRWHVQYGG